MLGIRFSTACVFALGGALITSAADAVQVCERSSARACKPVTIQASRAAPKATNAQRAATAARSRHTTRLTRRRHAVKHAQPDKPARQLSQPAVAAPAAPATQEKSPAGRRFSEFVSPRLLATNPVEEMHKPRMNVSELSGETAYPVLAEIDRDQSAAAIVDMPGEVKQIEAAEPPPQSAPQQTPAAVVPPVTAELSANPTDRGGSRDSPEGSAPWVRIVFLTWGGLLTLGSALRLLIG